MPSHKTPPAQLRREIAEILSRDPRRSTIHDHATRQGDRAEAIAFGTKWAEDRFREDPTYAAFTPEMVWIDPAEVPNAKKRETQKNLICSTAVKRWRELRDQARLSAAGHSQGR